MNWRIQLVFNWRPHARGFVDQCRTSSEVEKARQCINVLLGLTQQTGSMVFYDSLLVHVVSRIQRELEGMAALSAIPLK